MYATLEDSPALAAARRLAEVDGAIASSPTRLPALEDQICAEAGLWAPDAARRALIQARGDLPRAVALVRVWAAALPQLTALPLVPTDIQLVRRISAAYAHVPGGQWLGTSAEHASRLLEWDDDHPKPAVSNDADSGIADRVGSTPPTRADCGRVRDLLTGVPIVPAPWERDGADPAATTLRAPLDRATRLGVLARGDTAALVAFAVLVLSRRREAVIAEVTAGVAAVRVAHPRTGNPCTVAEVPVAEAEIVLDAEVDGRPGFAVGWGASLGALERRVVAIALLDGAMQADLAAMPARAEGSERGNERRDGATTYVLDEQTLLSVIDGSAATGFIEHLRLPHYASFASAVDQVRAAGAP
jgi:alpha-D-ribose 1-methylphosphonate 5-triphosphate synthase subunit PhnI